MKKKINVIGIKIGMINYVIWDNKKNNVNEDEY